MQYIVEYNTIKGLFYYVLTNKRKINKNDIVYLDKGQIEMMQSKKDVEIYTYKKISYLKDSLYIIRVDKDYYITRGVKRFLSNFLVSEGLKHYSVWGNYNTPKIDLNSTIRFASIKDRKKDTFLIFDKTGKIYEQ